MYTCYTTEIILVSPGNGQEKVYFPSDTNVTLHCKVNQTNPLWFIGKTRYTFEIEAHRNILNSRGIFQYGQNMSLNGVTVSHLIVFGDVTNNDTGVCCQAIVGTTEEENCTILMTYGRKLKAFHYESLTLCLFQIVLHLPNKYPLNQPMFPIVLTLAGPRTL